MKHMNNKILIAILIIILIALGIWAFRSNDKTLIPAVDMGAGGTTEGGEMGISAGMPVVPEEHVMEDGTMMEDEEAPAPEKIVVRELTVSGQNFSFSPAKITVKKGETVRITFKNTGGTHDLKIDEFNVATKKIAAGQSEMIKFVADKAGTFEYYCSVGNHRAQGMKGTLAVE